MTAFKKLTEDEMALWAIISDPSGVDLAEFSRQQPNAPGGVFRCRRYQYLWFIDDTRRIISATARATGKSLGLALKAMCFPFNSPGDDFFILAPGQDQLRPLTDELEDSVNRSRLTREMLNAHHGKRGISRIPSFAMAFKNGAKVVSRLAKLDGKGSRGQHAKVLAIDEAQQLPDPAGFVEAWPTFEEQLGGQILIYGVTLGLGGTFDQLSNNPRSGFKRWKKIAPERESWTDETRTSEIAQYGGSETHADYTRNSFGSSLGISADTFVTARLMAGVRIAESNWAVEYNEQVYLHVEAIHASMAARHQTVFDLFTPHASHLDPAYTSYWMGADLGLTLDPTEVLIFGYTETLHAKGPTYRLLCRITMQEISATDQVAVFAHVMRHYGDRLRRFSLDKTGLGLPIYQMMDEMGEWIQSRVAGHHFSEKVLAGWEDREREPGEKERDLEQKIDVKTYGLQEARKLVDAGQIELPYDAMLLASLLGTSGDHALDAMRMFAAAVALHRVDAIAEARKPEPGGAIWGFGGEY